MAEFCKECFIKNFHPSEEDIDNPESKQQKQDLIEWWNKILETLKTEDFQRK